MHPKNIALILVDIQNDFMPGGALAVPNGSDVIAVANGLMPHYDRVVATQDWHPKDHQSFASQHQGRQPGTMIDLHGLPQVLWPDHCVQDSKGAEFVTSLNTEDIHVFQKGTDPKVDSYSGFFDNGKTHATGLGDWLKSGGIEEVHVMGVATDYCVKFTALDAIALGFKTVLITDGVRGVNLSADDSEEALRDMDKSGVLMSTSHDLLS